MNYKTSRDGTTAVSTKFNFYPMYSCPIGLKVILDGHHGVAVIGTWDGKDEQWKGWSPLPGRK